MSEIKDPRFPVRVCLCEHDREDHNLVGECFRCYCEMFRWRDPDPKVIAELRAADERLWALMDKYRGFTS